MREKIEFSQEILARNQKIKKKRVYKDTIPIRDYYNVLKTSWHVQTKLFFENSTLHGVRYIAESGRPLIEKLMWFCCILVGAIATLVIIVSLWEKFQTNPTITGLDTDFHNWDVPFPAITICQSIPSNESIIDDFLLQKNDDKDLDASKDFLDKLTKLSFDSLVDFKNYVDQNVIPIDTNLKQLVFPLMNPCDSIFESCIWKSNEYNCCDGFFPVFTESGFCYSFNSKHYEKNVPGQQKELPNFQMRYIQETDIKWSLKFKIFATDENITIPIYIHNSDEVPGIDVQPQHIWDYKVDRISFSVKQTYTTDDTRQLSIKQRRCIFGDEIKLKIDTMYTYTACTRQCRMETAQKLCGCVPHFYPETGKFRHCKITELACIADHLNAIRSVDHCFCELGCSNTVYEVEKLNEGGKTDLSTSLEAEFVSWPMVRYKREVLFGWVDLLVSFGGIAGLFLGFSLLSGVEIVYYFTIRACCMVNREKDELERIYNEEQSKPFGNYNLSLTPYFIKKPLRNDGIADVAKGYYSTNVYGTANKIEPLTVKPVKKLPDNPIIHSPFGIEFLN